MNCPHCGKSIKEGSKACEYCGKRIEAEAVSRQESKHETSSTPSQKTEKREAGQGNKSTSSSRPSDPPEKDKKDSRSAEEKRETQRKGEEPPEEEGKKNKMALVFVGIFGGLFLLLAVFYFFSNRAPPPPPSSAGAFSGSEKFYTALGEAIQETGVAKRYFNEGLGVLALGGESQPAAMTQPAESAPSPQFLKAVEKFASALERFRFAQQTVDNVKLKPNDDLEVCKKSFMQILDRYVSASQNFKENAESISQGSGDKEIQSVAADAKGKYEMANQLMGKFLADGCKTEYFRFVATRNSVDKGAVFKAYQMVLLENFEIQRPLYEALFQYKPVSGNPSSESNPANP